MSWRRPSNASSRVSGPCGPVSVRLAFSSTMGRRRRAAAMASPSWVCAFSRTRSVSSSASKVARSTATGAPGFADSAFMTVPLLVFRVRCFGEPPVPLSGELGHGPGGLVEAVGFYLVENFPALFAPADQPSPFEHDQMFGDGLAGERHPSGQPAGAYLTVAEQEVENPATRRVADGRPQLIIGLRRHRDWRFASNVMRRSR